ncbi:MAG TPA: hypothetical protein VJ767_00735 [Nitrososphaeraceae archaeon]|nr:hypothetical protein [Nitrososphaeraceae archaeon]
MILTCLQHSTTALSAGELTEEYSIFTVSFLHYIKKSSANFRALGCSSTNKYYKFARTCFI